MKKIISVLMVLAILAGCVPAFGEAAGSIIGDWFVSYVVTPEGVLSAPGDAGYTQNFVINEDGSCVFTMGIYSGQSTSAEGTWTAKEDGGYELQFTEEMQFVAYVIEGQLVANASDGSFYYCAAEESGAQQVLPFTGYSGDAIDEDFFGEWVCGAVLYTNQYGGYDYYSKYILDADFSVNIGYDTQIGGYVADWYIGGVGGQVYNEEVNSHAIYELDESGDAMMYSMVSLSNGVNVTTYMYLDSTKETMHVYGIYGILVFTRADALEERPAVIEEVFSQYSAQ